MQQLRRSGRRLVGERAGRPRQRPTHRPGTNLNTTGWALFDQTTAWAAPTIRYIRGATDRIIARQINGTPFNPNGPSTATTVPDASMTRMPQREPAVGGHLLVGRGGDRGVDVHGEPGADADVGAESLR